MKPKKKPKFPYDKPTPGDKPDKNAPPAKPPKTLKKKGKRG